MTPIIGLIMAITAAQLAPNVRALLTAVLALMAAATAVQSWDIGASLGRNPASTIQEAGYWVVQAIIVSITLAVAYGCFALRRRKAARNGTSLVRPSFSGRRGVLCTSVIGALMTVVGIAFCLVVASVRTRNGEGNGHIPWTGVAGITAALVVLVVLAVAFLRDRRGSRHADAV